MHSDLIVRKKIRCHLTGCPVYQSSDRMDDRLTSIFYSKQFKDISRWDQLLKHSFTQNSSKSFFEQKKKTLAGVLRKTVSRTIQLYLYSVNSWQCHLRALNRQAKYITAQLRKQTDWIESYCHAIYQQYLGDRRIDRDRRIEHPCARLTIHEQSLSILSNQSFWPKPAYVRKRKFKEQPPATLGVVESKVDP